MNNSTEKAGIEAAWSRQLFTTISLSIVVAALLSVVATVASFESNLRPYLTAKTESVAIRVARDIEYALSVGVPFDRLRGIETYVEELKAEHKEVRDISIKEVLVLNGQHTSTASGVTNAGGPQEFTIFDPRPLLGALFGHASEFGVISVPITSKGQTVGIVSAEVNGALIVAQMQSVFFDSLVILVAVTLVALEVVVVLTGSRITGPLRCVEAAIRRRSFGDLSQYQAWGSTGLLNEFVARLNALNAQFCARARRLGHLASELTMRHQLDRDAPPKTAHIIDARIPLFVFCVAEELQKSFLPLFVSEHYKESDLFDKSLMVGLPISTFMFLIAVVTPFAGSLVDRYGNRRLFLSVSCRLS